MAGQKASRRERIKKGIRKNLAGTSERPRLSVFRSNKGIYAQIIDDNAGKTLVAASSLSKEFAASGNKVEQSKAVGKLVAEKAVAAGINKVVFDRNGRRRFRLLIIEKMALSNIKRVKSSEIELKDRLVSIQRVAKVTKGGRTFSFSAIVVVGDENGIVGYGLGKAKEVTEAITKGIDDAKKNLVKVPIIKGTVPHAQYGKYSGGSVLIKPAVGGTGVLAGGAMRAVLESAGIKDVLAKSLGSSNPHNVVKATVAALSDMRDAYTVAQHRGVDLNKVFNG